MDEWTGCAEQKKLKPKPWERLWEEKGRAVGGGVTGSQNSCAQRPQRAQTQVCG